MGRYALLVGISNYTADLNPLPSAVKDVEALRQVLVSPEMGGFSESDVTVLKDVEKGAIETAIYHLFANRKTDDLLIFYFSGHGVTDSRSDFYLTGLTTRKDALPPTAVSSNYVHDLMNKSRSKRQVIILDCCHSGAFPKGMAAKGLDAVNVLPKLGGEGRAILTASDSSQYAFEQEGFELSLYTHFLVEGLRGAADRDGDGEVSIDELYEYVRDQVRVANDSMSPEFYPVKEGHRIVLAKAAQDDPKLKYRKEIETRAKQNNGKFSLFARNILVRKRDEWGVSASDADAIEMEVLLPYREYEKKLHEFEQALTAAVAIEFPLSAATAKDLKDYEQYLGLREEDIKRVKSEVIAPKLSEYNRQFVSQQQRIAEAEQLKQRQAEVERLKRQQVEADLLRQQKAAEAERLRRQEEAEHIKQKQQSKPVQNEFEFEVVKVRLVKESGFLGIGSSTRIELDRKKGKAQYICENLGNGASLDLVRIPAGKFMMGMPADERQIALDNAVKYGNKREDVEKWLDWSTPQHQVTLKEFWMGKFTITNAQWYAVMGTNPSEKYDVKFQGKNQPVVGVSWDDTKEFCKKASEKTGKSIRLPSETEWEYACRAGTNTAFHFGETITSELVNYDGNYPYGDAPKGEYRQKTVNVDSFSPNAWGLYQMHGNVWEWCEDVWHDNYKGIPQDGSPWLKDGQQNIHLVRGGSWLIIANDCRSAIRSWDDSVDSLSNLGFRVVI